MDGPTRIKYPRPIYVLGCSPIMAHMQVRQTMIHLKAVQACREPLYLVTCEKARHLVQPLGVSEVSIAIPNSSRTLMVYYYE